MMREIRTLLEEDIELFHEALENFEAYSFRANVRICMDARGLSSSALGERMLVSHTIVDKWLQGKAKPNGKDRFNDEDVAFKDTIIIFTSNARRSLYKGDAKQNAAGVPRKTLINALETEENPQTGQPFFPTAITSRMATGWPLLFNHLQAHHLEKISADEMKRFCGLFEKQYGIEADFDSLVPTALLFSEGGEADARTLRAQTELFFKNEVFKGCRLFNEEHFGAALSGVKKLRFVVETDQLPDAVRPLFYCDEKPEILLYGSPLFAARCREQLNGFLVYDTQSVEEALSIAGKRTYG